MEEKFAIVSWSVDDVLTLRENWSREKAEEELKDVQKYLRDRLIEVGWTVLDTLLPK